MSLSDAALLDRWLRERDAEAFKVLTSRHAGMVYGTCRRILGNAADAEDAAQECFESLVEAGGKPGAYVGAWLHRVATNQSLNRVRTEQRRKERERRFTDRLGGAPSIVWNDVYDYVDEAIAQLPEDLRVPLVAHFLEDQTHETIAADLGVSRQTITYRINKGIDRVREMLRRRNVPLAVPALAALLSANLKAEATPASLAASLGKLAMAGVGPSVGASGSWTPQALLQYIRAMARVPTLNLISVGGVLVVLAGLAVFSMGRPDSDQLPVQGEIRTTPRSSGGGTEATASSGGLQETLSSDDGQASADTATAPEPGLGSVAVKVFETQRAGTTDSGIPGARVVLERGDARDYQLLPASNPRQESVTGLDGVVRFTDVPLGNWLLTAHTDELVGVVWTDLAPDSPHQTVGLALERAGSIAGRVTNPSGEAVAAACVMPYQFGDDPQPMLCEYPEALRTWTGADGRFTLPYVRKGVWRLYVCAAGCAGLVTDRIPTGGAPVALVVREGGQAQGIVTDGETAAPLEGVHVRVPGLTPFDDRSPVTDAGGRFLLPDLAPGDYRAYVFDSVYVGQNGVSSFRVVEGEETEIPSLYAVRGGVVEGRVCDADSGSPIVGAKVAIDADPPAAPAITDDAGRYTIRGGIERDRYQRHHEVYIAEARGYYLAGESAKTRVTLDPGLRLTNVDFALVRGRLISGRVTDASSRGVEGAVVTMSPAGRQGVKQRAATACPQTLTESDGTFSLEGSRPGEPVSVIARLPGLASERIGPLEPRQEGIQGLVLTLRPLGRIEGVVVTSRNEPLQDWQVRASSQGSDNDEVAMVHADGTFAIKEIAAGEYSLLVAAPRMQFDAGFTFRCTNGTSPVVTVRAGATVSGVRLVCDPGLTISGHVQGSTRTGSDFVVECVGPVTATVQTDDFGDYAAVGLVDGIYTVRVLCDMCCSARQEDVPAGSSNVDFMLHPKGAVEGRVIRKGDGRPVPAFEAMHVAGWIDRTPTSDDPDEFGEFVRVQHPDGVFKLTWVEAGEGTLIVRAPGYAEAFVRVPDVPGDAVVSDVLIELEPGAALSGRVVDEYGGAVAGAFLYVGAPPDAWTDQGAYARTASDGAFTIPCLPWSHTVPGGSEVVLSCCRPGYVPATVSVDSAHRDEVALVLARGGNIEGLVRLDGGPMPNQPLAAIPQSRTGDPAVHVVTGFDGSYRFPGTFLGEVVIQAAVRPPGTASREARTQAHTVTVQPGEAVTVDFDFEHEDGESHAPETIVGSDQARRH